VTLDRRVAVTISDSIRLGAGIVNNSRFRVALVEESLIVLGETQVAKFKPVQGVRVLLFCGNFVKSGLFPVGTRY